MSAKTLLAADPTLLTEAQLSGLVVELARLGGWRLRYHTLRSKGSPSGFPDWVFLHPGRTRSADEGHLQPEVLFVELKSEKGKLTEAQTAWMEALALFEEAIGSFYTAAHSVESAPYDDPSTYWYPVRVRIWRPSDWDEIVETLTGRKARKEA